MTAATPDEPLMLLAELLLNHPGPILVPAPVVVEVCQLLASRRSADVEAALLTSLGAGALRVIDLETAEQSGRLTC